MPNLHMGTTPHGRNGERTMERIYRWIPVERISHWSYVVLFLAALISGLAAGDEHEESVAGAGGPAIAHGTLGLLMIGLPIVLLLVFARKRMLEDIREVTHWDADDRLWLRKAIRGNALLRRQMPRQGRLNAGQKVSTMLVGPVALGIAASGCVLLFAGRAHLSNGAWDVTIGIHVGFIIFALVVLVGHLAHIVFLKGGTKYLRSMFSGWLDGETAKDHHYKWWEQAQSTRDAE
jgi:formate dehydrogenase subunit gamma